MFGNGKQKSNVSKKHTDFLNIGYGEGNSLYPSKLDKMKLNRLFFHIMDIIKEYVFGIYKQPNKQILSKLSESSEEDELSVEDPERGVDEKANESEKDNTRMKQWLSNLSSDEIDDASEKLVSFLGEKDTWLLENFNVSEKSFLDVDKHEIHGYKNNYKKILKDELNKISSDMQKQDVSHDIKDDYYLEIFAKDFLESNEYYDIIQDILVKFTVDVANIQKGESSSGVLNFSSDLLELIKLPNGEIEEQIQKLREEYDNTNIVTHYEYLVSYALFCDVLKDVLLSLDKTDPKLIDNYKNTLYKKLSSNESIQDSIKRQFKIGLKSAFDKMPTNQEEEILTEKEMSVFSKNESSRDDDLEREADDDGPKKILSSLEEKPPELFKDPKSSEEHFLHVEHKPEIYGYKQDVSHNVENDYLVAKDFFASKKYHNIIQNILEELTLDVAEIQKGEIPNDELDFISNLLELIKSPNGEIKEQIQKLREEYNNKVITHYGHSVSSALLCDVLENVLLSLDKTDPTKLIYNYKNTLYEKLSSNESIQESIKRQLKTELRSGGKKTPAAVDVIEKKRMNDDIHKLLGEFSREDGALEFLKEIAGVDSESMRLRQTRVDVIDAFFSGILTTFTIENLTQDQKLYMSELCNAVVQQSRAIVLREKGIETGNVKKIVDKFEGLAKQGMCIESPKSKPLFAKHEREEGRYR